LDDNVENKKMGGACSRCGERRSVNRLLWLTLKEKDHIEEAGLDGKIILKEVKCGDKH